MAQEIERKYLVKGSSWQSQVEKKSHYTQAYLASCDNNTVRLRISEEKAWITIKGPRQNLTAAEFEYVIPICDAKAMLALCPLPPLIKCRHFLTYHKKIWTIDVFEGVLTGLLLAEIELENATEAISMPPWIGEEVSHDPRYRNSALAAMTIAHITNGRLKD